MGVEDVYLEDLGGGLFDDFADGFGGGFACFYAAGEELEVGDWMLVLVEAVVGEGI